MKPLRIRRAALILLLMTLALWPMTFAGSARAASPNCNERDRERFRHLHAQAAQYHENRQFLLASTHFSFAREWACEKKEEADTVFGYALAMAELGETDEIMRALRELVELEGPSARRALAHALYLGGLPQDAPKSVETRVEFWNARFSPHSQLVSGSGHETIPSDPMPMADGRPNSAEPRQRAPGLGLSPLATGRVLELRNSLNRLPHKSPTAAGLLSALVPGAGQAYVGAWSSASVAFVLNGLFLATTLEFARKDLYAAAATSGLIFSITYVGNIVSAVDSAHRYNQGHARPVEQELHRNLFPELHPVSVPLVRQEF